MQPISQRVQKIIANAGLCSRRRAEELISQGKVKVNGKIIKLGDKALPNDEIIVDGKRLSMPKKKYLLLFKPKGFVTSLYDPHERRTVVSLLRERGVKERLIPVGRLDKDTSGLLIMTNDGNFANKVMHPRYEIEKTYLVIIDKELADKDKIEMESGIMIEGRKTWPAKIRMLSKSKFEITIHEGRNRMIRKMLLALGYNARSLVRVKIGNISRGNLKVGEFRVLNEHEIKGLAG